MLTSPMYEPLLKKVYYLYRDWLKGDQSSAGCVYTDADRVKWEKVLVMELILTDESDAEGGEAVLVMKELTWRSDSLKVLREVRSCP